MTNGERFDAAFSTTTERQALVAARDRLMEIMGEWDGPNFPGRAHKLRAVHLPALMEIVKEGLGDG